MTPEFKSGILSIRREPMSRIWGPLKIATELGATAARYCRRPRQDGWCETSRTASGYPGRGGTIGIGPAPSHMRNSVSVTRKPSEILQTPSISPFGPAAGRFTGMTSMIRPPSSQPPGSPPHLTAGTARDALAEMLEEIPYPVVGIQTDNGSEYRGVSEEFLQERDIRQQVVHPRTSKRNAHVERFHGIVDREMHAVWLIAIMIEKPSREIADYIHHYNHHRPHQAFGGRPSTANLRELFPALLCSP